MKAEYYDKANIMDEILDESINLTLDPRFRIRNEKLSDVKKLAF